VLYCFEGIICDVQVYVDVECMLDVVNIHCYARKISDTSKNKVKWNLVQ